MVLTLCHLDEHGCCGGFVGWLTINARDELELQQAEAPAWQVRRLADVLG